jgi:hypothetical protein
MTSQLQKMGIDREIATYCLASVAWQSIERALAFRFEEDEFGMLVHDHVPGLYDHCFICEKTQDDHAAGEKLIDDDEFFGEKLLDGAKESRPSMNDVAIKL